MENKNITQYMPTVLPFHNEVFNVISVNVEDYFHTTHFAKQIPSSIWSAVAPQATVKFRLAANLEKVLCLFEQLNIKGTFFVLGEVARKYPHLIRTIHTQGHELASHGDKHRLVDKMTPTEFKEDTIKAVKSLEDITGEKVLGYRAAAFSITKSSPWAFEILAQLGIQYDSSIFPSGWAFQGLSKGYRYPYQPIAGVDFWELPLCTLNMFLYKLPCTGGAYLRFLPCWIHELAIARINRSNTPAVIYLHPWELDLDQPRVSMPFLNYFKHYGNRLSVEQKIAKLSKKFNLAPVRKVLLL